MLTGERVALRARLQADVPALHAALQDDVDVRSRTSEHPWVPIAPEHSTFAPSEEQDEGSVRFSVVTRADDELVGSAIVWGINTHNRSAHVGLSMLPAARGRGLGTDALRVLCGYCFRTRGFHRVQVETLGDNAAMLGAAAAVGFVQEGVMRASEWVQGEFLDLVVLGLLSGEWWAGQ